MAAPAIVLEGVGKRYRLGQLGPRYDTLREALLRGPSRAKPATFWALQDIDLEIEEGEIVGLIGRNGAGKTTLLRILSRITKPTVGTGELHGRVGSLLEVGTGFHPELTGRENVFLNGAVLGMRREEVRRKFDEIVDFAGVEAFIDTPVKRFSTGMYVRLAFSIAAHLEPEILLVDEVLAVGDAEFQKRSLGKMEEVGRSGRTVVLVSHSMPSISSLCERVLLLDSGRLVMDGPPERVVGHYLTGEHGTSALRTWAVEDAPGNDVARLLRVRVHDEAGVTRESVDIRDAVGIEVTFDVLRGGETVAPLLAFRTEGGVHAFTAVDPDPRWRGPAPGRYVSTAWVPGNLLNETRYGVAVFLTTIMPGKTEKHVSVWDAVAFQTVNSRSEPSAKGEFLQPWDGAVSPMLEWEVSAVGAGVEVLEP